MTRSTASGLAAATLTVLIWASYPVATRAGLNMALTPDHLVFLRFGVGALFFVPYLLFRWRDIDPVLWRRGVPLALCQGAGMAALVIFGLRYAPASHAAALGPGGSPAWVALLGLIFFGRRPDARQSLGAAVTFAGVVCLLWFGASSWSATVLLGDSMFVLASALGALYVLQLQRYGTDPWQGAAVVAAYSAIVVVPWYLLAGTGPMPSFDSPGMWLQLAWQGLLIGFVSLVSMSHAISRLGGGRASAAFAAVPPLSVLLAYLFLDEAPSRLELGAVVAISLGVAIAVSRSPARPPGAVLTAVRAPLQAGSPAACNAVVNRAACGLSRPG